MKLRDIKLLERVFDAEINDRLPAQIRSKWMEVLEAGGYVCRMVRHFGSVTVTGWELTHLGRYTYCQYAANETRENHPSAPRPKPRQRR